jgi:hypothetical protein
MMISMLSLQSDQIQAFLKFRPVVIGDVHHAHDLQIIDIDDFTGGSAVSTAAAGETSSERRGAVGASILGNVGFFLGSSLLNSSGSVKSSSVGRSVKSRSILLCLLAHLNAFRGIRWILRIEIRHGRLSVLERRRFSRFRVSRFWDLRGCFRSRHSIRIEVTVISDDRRSIGDGVTLKTIISEYEIRNSTTTDLQNG